MHVLELRTPTTLRGWYQLLELVRIVLAKMSEPEQDAAQEDSKPVESIEGNGEEDGDSSGTGVTDEQWKAMLTVCDHVSNHKIEVKGEE